jgi:hypothetical protein
VLPILRRRGRWRHPAPENGGGLVPSAPASGPGQPAAAS